MNFLLNEIVQAKFDMGKLRLLVPAVHELDPESPIRRLFEQAGRIAKRLKVVPSYLDEIMGFISKRQDAEIDMQIYYKFLDEARNE